jgi:hypothetical protein
MKRYVEGQDRSQAMLFPESLDEYIAEIIRCESSTSSSMSWI